MIKQNKSKKAEFLVGLLVLCIFAILGVFTIVLSDDSIFSKKYPLRVYFNDISGIRDGDNVLMRGVKIGVVRGIEVLPEGVLVNISADQEITLHQGYQIAIKSSSALGGKHIAINEGNFKKAVVNSDEALRGTDPVVLMDDASELLHDLRVALKDGGVLDNLKTSMQNLAEVSEKINNGDGTLAKLISDDEIYNDVKSTTSELKSFSDKLNNGEGTIAKLVNDDEVYDRVNLLITNLSEFSENLANNEGTLGKLVNDREAYDRLNNVLKNLEVVTSRLEKGEGTLGKLSLDDQLYSDIQKLVKEIRAGIDDMREASPVTTFSNVMMGAF